MKPKNITEEEYESLHNVIVEVLVEEGIGSYVGKKKDKFVDQTVGLVKSNITKATQRKGGEIAAKIMSDKKSMKAIDFMVGAMMSKKPGAPELVEEGLGSWFKTNFIDVLVDGTVGEFMRGIDRKVNAKITRAAGKIMDSAGIVIAQEVEDQLNTNEAGMLGSKRMKDSLSKVLNAANKSEDKALRGLASKSAGGTNYQISTAFLNAFFSEAVISEQQWAKNAKAKMKKLSIDGIGKLVADLDKPPYGGLGLNSNIVKQIAKKLKGIPSNIGMGKLRDSIKAEIVKGLPADMRELMKDKNIAKTRTASQKKEDKIKAKEQGLKLKEFYEKLEEPNEQADAITMSIMLMISYAFMTTLYDENVLSKPILTIETKKELRKKKGKMLSADDAKADIADDSKKQAESEDVAL